MVGLEPGTVELAEWSPGWRAAYEREAARLRGLAAGRLLGVEHVGSTAVEALVARPVVDVLALASDENGVVGTTTLLTEAGYERRPDDDGEDRVALARGPPDERTHHVSVTPAGSDAHREQVAFRSALQADPELRAEYAGLKRELATTHPDEPAAYTDAKSAFVERVLDDVPVGRR